MAHKQTCSEVGCTLCNRVTNLYSAHARSCPDSGSCNVPNCADIKANMAQPI